MTVQEVGAPPNAPERPPSRWLGPVRVTGAVLGAGLIGLGTLSVMAQFATRVAHESFSIADPVQALTVDVGSGDVHIYADPSFTSVEVEVTTRSAFRKATYAKSVQDKTLALTGSCSGSWVSLDNCSVSYQITVPSDVTVDVHTSSGDQIITDVTKAVRLRTGSGDIGVHGITGSVTARTGSGDIKADRLTSTQAELRTGSGDIRAEFALPPAEVNAKTGSGDVRVSVPDDGTHYDVTGTTGSGDRHIEVPTGSGTHRIDATTGSGDVTINFP